MFSRSVRYKCKNVIRKLPWKTLQTIILYIYITKRKYTILVNYFVMSWSKSVKKIYKSYFSDSVKLICKAFVEILQSLSSLSEFADRVDYCTTRWLCITTYANRLKLNYLMWLFVGCSGATCTVAAAMQTLAWLPQFFHSIAMPTFSVIAQNGPASSWDDKCCSYCRITRCCYSSLSLSPLCARYHTTWKFVRVWKRTQNVKTVLLCLRLRIYYLLIRTI